MTLCKYTYTHALTYHGFYMEHSVKSLKCAVGLTCIVFFSPFLISFKMLEDLYFNNQMILYVRASTYIRKRDQTSEPLVVTKCRALA